jgi:2-haloacid dehalogenase
MAELRSRGLRVGILTNGSAALTAHLVDLNGLRDHVERIVSSDEVQVWKPNPAPYRHATGLAGLPPDDVAMVAVHAWDTHGARGAGLTAAWAARLEGTFSPSFDEPHVRGADLVEVAAALLELPPATTVGGTR